MKNLSTPNKLKIASIICFSLITIALIIAKNTPANGYEFSIYASTPVFVWLSLILSLLIGTLIIFYHIWTGNYKNKYLLITGFILIILTNVIVLSLHIIRGYYMWMLDGDPATHIGYVDTILKNGFVPDYLFYPILHIYTSIFSQITSLTVFDLSKFLPLYFALIFIIFMYLFSKSILPKKGEVILATLASLTFIYGFFLSFTPNHFASLLFPMALFIVIMNFTKKKYQWAILLVLIAILYPASHIIPTIVLIIIVATFGLPKLIYNKIKMPVKLPKILSNLRATTTLLMSVLAITWISSFYVWNKTIENIHTILTEGGTTQLNELVISAVNAQLKGFDIITYALKEYGGNLIYLLIALLSIFMIWRELKKNKKYSSLFSLCGPLIFIVIFTGILYFVNLMFGPNRMIFYITVISTVFVGFFLFKLLKKSKEIKKFHINKITPILLSLLIIGIFINGILILYPSPYTLNSNQQTTKMELEGMYWYFDSCQWATNVTMITIFRDRFADLINPDIRKIKTPYRYSAVDIPPYHFEYNQSSIVNKKTYLLLTKRDEDLYRHVFPSLAAERWYNKDFKSLESNNNFQKIYSNGEFTINYLNTTSK